MRLPFSRALALGATLTLAALLITACEEEPEYKDTIGLCFAEQGNRLSTVCSGGYREGNCESGYSWYNDYADFTECGDASRRLLDAYKRDGTVPRAGGSTGGGSSTGGGGGDCFASCPSEKSDVQLDSFCRAACCYTITGQTSQAAATCQSGSSLGSSSCKYCR